MTGSATIIRANSRSLPLPDNSVDLIVTSPPYFALRSYQDGGEHYAGQLGSEPTPAEFVDSLIEVTRECMRVLKPSGSLFVNLGDKYAGSGGGGEGSSDGQNGRHARPPRREVGIATKSLMGMPWRYALRCIDDLGLILRAEVIWSKPNGLPESVTDRVRRSHEQWFHFVQQPRYFSAVDEIRESTQPARAHALTWDQRKAGEGRVYGSTTGMNGHTSGGDGMAANPLGKLPGSVWTIPTQPLTVPAHLGVDHFAAFPMDWPRRIIKGWAPTRGVCTACGEGRRPVPSATYDTQGRTTNGPKNEARRSLDSAINPLLAVSSGVRAVRETTITGYACACPEPTAPTTPATVLDPFGGTGTTALVAKVLGCHGISVDMSHDYCRLAEWRTNDPGEIARAMQVDKPAEQVQGQADLFDLIQEASA